MRDFKIEIDDANDLQNDSSSKPTSLVASLLAKHVKPLKSATSLEEELNRFGNVTVNNENILQFWKINQNDYPKLAKIAKVLLGIPMTSAKSEGAFSTTGCLIRKDRASITPYKIERALFIHDNYDLIKV